MLHVCDGIISIDYLFCDGIISKDNLFCIIPFLWTTCYDTISVDYLLWDDTISLDSVLNDGIITLDQPAQHEVGGSQGTVQCQPQINVLGSHTGNSQQHYISQLKIGQFVL